MADPRARRAPAARRVPPWAILSAALSAAAALLFNTIPVFQTYDVTLGDILPEIRRLEAARRIAMEEARRNALPVASPRPDVRP